MKKLYNFICEKLLISKDTQKQVDKKADDPSTWDVGDILAGTAGYSMQLPRFYKITKITPKMVTAVRIHGKIVSGHRNGQWEEVADENSKPIGEPCRGKVRPSGSVKLDGTYLHLWNGKPLSGDDMD